MRKSLLRAALVLLLAGGGAAAVLAATGGTAKAPPRPLVGFNTYINGLTVGLARRVGATVQRTFVPWSAVEAVRGTWSWGETDRQYAAARRAGIRPLLVALYAPCWARPSSGCAPQTNGPPDPAFDADWRDFARRLAARYPRALGIEIWNEPNLRQVFTPDADPVRYTQLLKDAYQAVKAVDPDMPVISGGLLAGDVEADSVAGKGDRTFLRGMLAAGAGRWMDAIGVHPYPSQRRPDGTQRWQAASALRTVRHLHAIAAAAGFGRLPVWITEVGESTATQPGFPPAVTPAQQARDLVAIIRAATRSRLVRVLVIHTLGDARPTPAQPATGDAAYNGVNSGFGVFDADLHPKPAACAIGRELGGTLRC